METWKAVNGFENYEASTSGRVRKGGLILCCFDNKLGYMVIRLAKNGCRKRFYLHRLILQTFNPSNNPKLEVNHKDHNKKNNQLDNLEWVTHKDNLRKAVSFLGKKAFRKK